jgi:hypothetical protein
VDRPLLRVGDEVFPARHLLCRRVRAIISRYADDVPLDDADRDFLVALLEYHRHRDQKIGVGVRAITVRTNHPGATRGFWLARCDGSCTDFSWVKCVFPPAAHTDLLRAMRHAIRHQVRAFKQQYFASRTQASCPVTGDIITLRNHHIDHEPPLTFKVLAGRFLDERGLASEAVALRGSGDGAFYPEFADTGLEREWQEFHRVHCRLRVVSKQANLSLPRK